MDTINKRLRSFEGAPMNGTTKDECDADFNGIDRISNLPSEILCHILSLMPTKDAIATCILSTKWRSLFPLIPNLRLELHDALNSHRDKASDTYLLSFRNFVNRLFTITLHDVNSIYSLSLICKKFDDGQTIASWIYAALRLSVKRMDLRLHQLKNSNFVFVSLFGCNIVSLNLSVDVADDAPECKFSLPSLRMLSVQYLKLNVINVLLESCPTLESLLVNYCSGEMLRICIPSLTVLKLFNGSFEGGEVELDAPKLQYLKYGGYLARRYLIKKLKSIQEAHLDLAPYHTENDYEYDEQAGDLVKACSDVRKLWLSDDMITVSF